MDCKAAVKWETETNDGVLSQRGSPRARFARDNHRQQVTCNGEPTMNDWQGAVNH